MYTLRRTTPPGEALGFSTTRKRLGEVYRKVIKKG